MLQLIKKLEFMINFNSTKTFIGSVLLGTFFLTGGAEALADKVTFVAHRAICSTVQASSFLGSVVLNSIGSVIATDFGMWKKNLLIEHYDQSGAKGVAAGVGMGVATSLLTEGGKAFANYILGCPAEEKFFYSAVGQGLLIGTVSALSTLIFSFGPRPREREDSVLFGASFACLLTCSGSLLNYLSQQASSSQ